MPSLATRERRKHRQIKSLLVEEHSNHVHFVICDPQVFPVSTAAVYLQMKIYSHSLRSGAAQCNVMKCLLITLNMVQFYIAVINTV